MFDVTIEQKVLMKALEYLEPTVGKNANSLGDNCISMKTTGNGSLELYTTNTIEFTKLEAIVSNGGNTQEQAPLVDFKRFKTIINSIPSNEHVSLRANVNDLLINFSLKPTPVKLVGCNNGMLPLPSVSVTSMMSIPKKLVEEALTCACGIITDSTSAPIYNCIRIATNGIQIEATGLDFSGKRTFVKSGTATNSNPASDVLVEASKLKKVMKIYEDFYEMEFNMSNSVVMVKGADLVPQVNQKAAGMITDIAYYARRINGVYPVNIAQNFVPAPIEFSEINKQEVLNSIARVRAIEDKTVSNDTIQFEVTGNIATISLSSAYGNVEDKIVAENAINIQLASVFKYSHLSDIIKSINGDTFEIGVLPNHPAHYVIREKGSNNVMFTIAGIIGQNATP